MVVCLIEFRICGKQYNGSIVTTFCARGNNFKSTHRNFRKEQKVPKKAHNQERFHEDFLQSGRNEIMTGKLQ